MNYRKSHKIENFAGNLQQLKILYQDSNAECKAEIVQHLERIVDGLVMPNGVKKTTYGNRQTHILDTVLSRVKLPYQEIRVLDLPSSTGAASLQNRELLQKDYRIATYVLGDLYHNVIYDARRRCIFDERENLLQVAFKQRYFCLYKGHRLGNEYTSLSECLLLPHSIAASCLRKLYRFDPDSDNRRLLVVHPEIERGLNQGLYRLEVMDIFQPIPDQYDVILSFNLLQSNYFTPEIIVDGIANLAASLSEGGLMVLGNTDSFWALQKRDGSLTTRLRKGNFTV